MLSVHVIGGIGDWLHPDVRTSAWFHTMYSIINLYVHEFSSTFPEALSYINAALVRSLDQTTVRAPSKIPRLAGSISKSRSLSPPWTKLGVDSPPGILESPHL
jgi:hypothetical protein